MLGLLTGFYHFGPLNVRKYFCKFFNVHPVLSCFFLKYYFPESVPALNYRYRIEKSEEIGLSVICFFKIELTWVIFEI